MENRAMELRFNHAQLQVTALGTREHQERLEKERLQFTCSMLEEEKEVIAVFISLFIYCFVF
jgi:hypothetical protein